MIAWLRIKLMGDPNPLQGLSLSREWLADTARLADYTAWTQRENDSWIVSKDTRQTRNERFWANLEARKAQSPKTNVRPFERKASA